MTRVEVSILTGPEGPVQPKLTPRWSSTVAFQSSPVPKDRCNRAARGPEPAAGLFQSSPVPKDRCNPPPGGTMPPPVCFNPHRSRRTGATMHKRGGGQEWMCFNPHRSRRTGATDAAMVCLTAAIVSILTGPEGPVQPPPDLAAGRPTTVSILTGPEGPVQQDMPATMPACVTRFNPHRSRRTGATSPGAGPPGGRAGFNPHRSRRTGATHVIMYM